MPDGHNAQALPEAGMIDDGLMHADELAPLLLRLVAAGRGFLATLPEDERAHACRLHEEAFDAALEPLLPTASIKRDVYLYSFINGALCLTGEPDDQGQEIFVEASAIIENRILTAEPQEPIEISLKASFVRKVLEDRPPLSEHHYEAISWMDDLCREFALSIQDMEGAQ
jgi:hypothetical protein